MYVSRYILSGSFFWDKWQLRSCFIDRFSLCKKRCTFCKKKTMSIVCSKMFSYELKYVNLNANLFFFHLSFYWHVPWVYFHVFQFHLIIPFLQHEDFWWLYNLRHLSLTIFTVSFNKQLMIVILILLLK